MLESILSDLAFSNGSAVADNVSTYFMVKKEGIQFENNLATREGMERDGIGRYLTKNTFKECLEFAVVGGLLYGLDHLFGIKDSALNLHHAFVYGFGSIKYLAAASNTLYTLGMERAAMVPALPVYLFLKVTKPLKLGRYDGI